MSQSQFQGGVSPYLGTAAAAAAIFPWYVEVPELYPALVDRHKVAVPQLAGMVIRDSHRVHLTHK